MDSFQPVLIEDSRLSGITDKIDFAVLKGGSQITEASFKAISATPSNIVFNVQVPSETTLISRNAQLSSTVTLQLNITGVPTDSLCFNYGVSDSLQNFPLQSLFSVASATINNTSVSINLQDVLPALMLLNQNDDLMEFNDTTNILPDSFYFNYGATFNSSIQNNNVLAACSSTDFNGAANPRGCLPIAISSFSYTQVPTTGSPTTTTEFSWANLVSTSAADSWTIGITYTVTEPLLLSPWIFGNPVENTAFYGIQNLNFQFNIGSTNRVWSSANSWFSNPANVSISVVSFQNTTLGFTFISPQPSMLLKSRNVVPFYSLPRYLSTQDSTTVVPASTYSPTASAPSGYYVNGVIYGTSTINTQSIQLNQIPQLLIIMVRKPMGTQTFTDSTSFLPISGISINFNNTSGLLSNATQMQLYEMSKCNGSTQTWSQFCGFSNQTNSNTSTAGSFYPVATTGSLLVLQFGKDIPLPDYYAPSSLGAFNLQVRLQVYNQSLTYPIGAPYTPANFNADSLYMPVTGVPVTPEVCMIPMESGIFVTDRGTSNIYTGVLTKSDVLNTSALEPYSSSEVSTMIGGSLHDSLFSSVARRINKHHKKPQNVIGSGLGTAVSGGKLGRHVK